MTNLTGHRFPSGVGFRRAFIELLVIEKQDERQRLVWSSGRTNDVGVIVDARGTAAAVRVLHRERTRRDAQQHYQTHHETITSDDQVQIYEELTRDAAQRFTTSFLRRDHEVKDNRLLPLGWTPDRPRSLAQRRVPRGDVPEGRRPSAIPTIATARDPTR